MMGVQINAPTFSTTIAVDQVFTVRAQLFGRAFPPPLRPTGTVSFTVTDSSSVTTTIGTATLGSGTFDYEALSGDLPLALGAGAYTITATYSGDTNVSSATATLSLTVDSSPIPALAPNPTDCVCAGPVTTPPGLGPGRGVASVSGVDPGTGAVSVVRSDLSSAAFGQSWINASGYSDGTSGRGATATQTPHLVQVNGDDSIAAVANAGTAYFFDLYGGAYHERFGGTASFSHDTTAHTFVLTDGTGQTFTPPTDPARHLPGVWRGRVSHPGGRRHVERGEGQRADRRRWVAGRVRLLWCLAAGVLGRLRRRRPCHTESRG
jgi:hypothetical protein